METVTPHSTLCIKINPPLRKNERKIDDENADHQRPVEY